MADLSSEKLSLHLIQCSVVLYCWFCLSEMSDASRLYTVIAVGPIPPVVLKTSGEKDPCSISRTRSS